MQNRHIDRKRYFDELAKTSEEFYIDYLKPYKNIGPGCNVLEIGCGEGGNLLPFAQAGCKVAGLDLAAGKIDNARKFFATLETEGEFACADFLKTNPFEKDGLFDIILIHDVIEHIEPEGKDAFFERLKMYLKPDGIISFRLSCMANAFRRSPADLPEQGLLQGPVHARAACFHV